MPGIAIIEAIMADITLLPVDAICNTAGRALRGGGGVDGAIHRKAGPRLAEACQKIGFCEIGDAKITWGFNLPARLVIHTSAPKWQGGGRQEADLLQSCYRTSLELADGYGAASVAFPAIGCGVRGFPKAEAAKIAISAVRDSLKKCSRMSRVIFACQDKEFYEAISSQIMEMGNAIRTAEEWHPNWKEIKVTSRDYWVNIFGMLQHHWVLIEPCKDGHEILFMTDYGGVFDRIKVEKKYNFKAALQRNGFTRWGPGTDEAGFVPLPRARPHKANREPVYSDGTYWK